MVIIMNFDNITNSLAVIRTADSNKYNLNDFYSKASDYFVRKFVSEMRLYVTYFFELLLFGYVGVCVSIFEPYHLAILGYVFSEFLGPSLIIIHLICILFSFTFIGKFIPHFVFSFSAIVFGCAVMDIIQNSLDFARIEFFIGFLLFQFLLSVFCVNCSAFANRFSSRFEKAVSRKDVILFVIFSFVFIIILYLISTHFINKYMIG